MSFGQREGGFGSRGGFGSSENSFKPKPVEVGKEYEVTISDISRRGDGIAKIGGFVTFVAGGKQGQSAKIKVTQVSNRYAMGTVVEGSGTTAASGISNAAEVAEITEELEDNEE
ncbi:MAG TPA: TRAM domain-containing protein [Nitrososphaerales archaeon]|nr:TRAM domain-containing protein [Nitrososphaerales archaeon]